MKLKNNFYILAASILMLLGCDGNYRNIQISGKVFSQEKTPLANAEIVLKCWVYQTDVWESTIVEKTVFSDDSGFFAAEFEKGEAVDLTVNLQGFKSKEISKTFKRNKVDFEISLEKK